MKLTTKCRYGVRAVLEIAKNYNIRPTSCREIAELQDIPESYLENILIELKRAGLIISVRGAKGGFLLNRSPSSFTMLDIVLVLQKSIVPVDCILNPKKCSKVDSCIARPLWQKMYKVQENVLKSFTTIDLLDNQLADLDCLPI
ncbi:MAG: Rrf2 family transcriptional regulator [Deltaproteobacteria bacterium]|nr:Rrf2 family transcriptional regulator [Deltaproteobacteria bacterium]